MYNRKKTFIHFDKECDFNVHVFPILCSKQHKTFGCVPYKSPRHNPFFNIILHRTGVPHDEWCASLVLTNLGNGPCRKIKKKRHANTKPSPIPKVVRSIIPNQVHINKKSKRFFHVGFSSSFQSFYPCCGLYLTSLWRCRKTPLLAFQLDHKKSLSHTPFCWWFPAGCRLAHSEYRFDLRVALIRFVYGEMREVTNTQKTQTPFEHFWYLGLIDMHAKRD